MHLARLYCSAWLPLQVAVNLAIAHLHQEIDTLLRFDLDFDHPRQFTGKIKRTAAGLQT